MFGAHSGQHRINASDFMLGDVDLDQFLDNYLVQLHSDGGGQAQARVQQQGQLGQQQQQQQLGQLGQLGQFGGMGFPPQQQQPQQGGVMAGFNGMPGLNLGAGNPMSSLALFQQQQQQLQQQQQVQALQQGLATSVPSGGATKSGTAKGRGKGRASAGKPSKKSEGEMSSSGESDSDDDESDEEQRNRKRQATAGMDDAERRHQALQEKNRRAQRRFRERQKAKLQDLHKQIDELTTKVGSLQSENSALHSRTNILEKVLDMRNEQIQVMQETKEAAGYPGSEEDLTSLQGVGGHLIQLTPETIKELGSDQIYKIYQMYVKELSVRLMDGNKGPEAEAESLQEMEGLVKDLSMMIMRLGVIKPLETRKFIVVSRQYLGNTEAEVIELWKNVMKSIDLNEQQKREVVELKRMFLQKIDPIMEERKLLNVQIQSNLPHDTFATKNALTYIKAHEAVIKLRDNLRAEQHVVLEFAIAVFRGVFKPWQMATLLVKCYPAVPDALGIASALAVELGEPDLPHTRQLTLQLGGYLEGSNASSAAAHPGAISGGLGLAMPSGAGPSGLNNMLGGLGDQLGARLSGPHLESFAGAGGFGAMGFQQGGMSAGGAAASVSGSGSGK